AVAGHNFDIARVVGRHKLEKNSCELSSCYGLSQRRWWCVQKVECKMARLLKTGVVGVLMACALAGCTNPYDPGQRAAGGALIGAGSGAAIGAIAGGPAGAAIG